MRHIVLVGLIGWLGCQTRVLDNAGAPCPELSEVECDARQDCHSVFDWSGHFTKCADGKANCSPSGCACGECACPDGFENAWVVQGTTCTGMEGCVRPSECAPH
jgi:hypothetical protein